MINRVVSCVFCDLVRKEVGNKDILIGVYGGNLNLPAYPYHGYFSIWLEFDAPVGRHAVDVKISFPSTDPPIEFSIELDVVETGNTSFFLNGIPLSFNMDGSVDVTVKSADFTTLALHKVVELSKKPHPVVPPQG